jgi:hypothetical protein
MNLRLPLKHLFDGRSPEERGVEDR